MLWLASLFPCSFIWMEVLMDFDDVESNDCMPEVALRVADDIGLHVRQLYLGMIERSAYLENGLPNVVLTGLTIVWLEQCQELFGSASFESAVSMLRSIRPHSNEIQLKMKRSAADLLRRSGWSLKRRKA